MAIEITLPSLGDDIESGDVLEVLVAEGEVIEKDQGVVELETDKATVAVPSTHAGTVVKIHVSEGDTIPVGGVIISLEPVAAETESSPKKSAPAKKKSPPKMPAANMMTVPIICLGLMIIQLPDSLVEANQI